MIRELQTWEWHRAVVAGIFALIAEVALATSMILDRIGKAPAAAPASVRTASSSSSRRRQSPVTTSRGLRDTSRTNVFIPLLMGAGILLSGLAWLVERIAGRTAGGSADRRLARRLHRALPEPGPLAPRLAQPEHPALVPLLAPRRRT